MQRDDDYLDNRTAEQKEADSLLNDDAASLNSRNDDGDDSEDDDDKLSGRAEAAAQVAVMGNAAELTTMEDVVQNQRRGRGRGDNDQEIFNEVETAITNFSQSLNNNVKSNKRLPRTNLTKLQYNCLHSIKNNNQLIVCTSDKNLGPVIMDRAEYFQRCLHEHLLCPRTYIRLTKEDALQKIRNTRCMLNQIRLNHRTKLTAAENTYFMRAANLKYRIPQF